MQKVLFLIGFFLFSTAAVANKIPPKCRLDCAEQFKFLVGINEQTNLSDFKKIYGAPFKIYKSEKKYILYEFRGAVTHTAVVERHGEIFAIGIFELNKFDDGHSSFKSKSIPVPNSSKTLYDWPFNIAKGCSKISDIEKFSLGAAAGDYLLSGFCNSKTKAFDYMRFLYSGYEPNCIINDEQKVISCGSNNVKVDAFAVILSKNKIIQHPFLGEIGGNGDIRPETWIVECVLNQDNC